MSSIVNLSLVAARPALVASRENTVDVLVRVQAPDAPKSGLPPRPSLNLALAIDRSGSMSGQPLHEAKRCAALMIESLNEKDRASIVAYDDQVQVVAENQPVKSREHIKAAIGHIHDGGTTNLHGGWLRGAEEAAKCLAPDCVCRVLLLSDGNANVGLTNIDEIASKCSQLADTGVTTSTYGLGRSFNEELMMAMARAGRGNGYYSDTAESLMERFCEEFSLLAALCARVVRLSVSTLPGVGCELLNIYETAKNGTWRLPDLVYDGEAWAVLRLKIDATALPAAGEQLALVLASVTFRNLEGTEENVPEQWLTLPIVSEDDFQRVAGDEDVIRRVKEAEAARLQEFAGRAARKGDWKGVERFLADARRLSADSPWLSEVVSNLERLAARRDEVLFSKEARYSSASMSARVRHKKEAARLSNEDALPSYLQRKIRQGAAASGATASSETYRLEPFSDLPAAIIEDKLVLLSTGLPFSLWRGDDFTIGGLNFSGHPDHALTIGDLSRASQLQLDAALGTDILSQLVVSFDCAQARFHVWRNRESLAGAEIPIRVSAGLPVVSFEYGGAGCEAIFDCGSKLCYAPMGVIEGMTPVDCVKGFHFLCGPFDTDVYELKIKVLGHSLVARFGVLPGRIASGTHHQIGAEWILGAALLMQGEITVDMDRARMAVLWKQGKGTY